jgi:uncharacterized protein
VGKPLAETNLGSYVEGFLARRRAAERRDAEYREHLMERLPAAVQLLVDEFGANRVVLFGSLARGSASERSDVDLLVEGLAISRVIDATIALERLLGGPAVDVVPLTAARPEVRERAEHEGIVLHG